MSAVLTWPAPAAENDSVDLVKRAKTYLKVLRARREHFGEDVAALMRDPAYELLLDLYVARRSGKPVHVTSAAMASGVPLTTGLRILDQLIQAGAVLRMDDPHDRRRRLIALADRMVALIERHLSALNL